MSSAGDKSTARELGGTLELGLSWIVVVEEEEWREIVKENS